MSGYISKSMAVVDFGKPLEVLETEVPPLQGTEVLVRNTYAGMCHSDLHLWEGEIGGFKVGGKPPFVVGHEFEGEVVAVGPDVKDKSIIGKNFACYPWLGCDEKSQACAYCKPGIFNLCDKPDTQRFVDGKSMYGGYASHVVMPDPKYLIDYEGALPEGLGGAYMCSGLTAFSALKKVGTPPNGGGDVLILGLGGLGFQGLHFSTAMFGSPPMAADIKPEAREAAAGYGATVFDSSDAASIAAIKEASGGGVFAVVDFVGSTETYNYARSCIRKGGQVIVVGLFGGNLDGANANLAMYAIQSVGMHGSMTGSFPEVQEMMQLLRDKDVPPIPHRFISIHDVNQGMLDLQAGQVTGRTILKHDWTEKAKM